MKVSPKEMEISKKKIELKLYSVILFQNEFEFQNVSENDIVLWYDTPETIFLKISLIWIKKIFLIFKL